MNSEVCCCPDTGVTLLEEFISLESGRPENPEVKSGVGVNTVSRSLETEDYNNVTDMIIC